MDPGKPAHAAFRRYAADSATRHFRLRVFRPRFTWQQGSRLTFTVAMGIAVRRAAAAPFPYAKSPIPSTRIAHLLQRLHQLHALLLQAFRAWTVLRVSGPA